MFKKNKYLILILFKKLRFNIKKLKFYLEKKIKFKFRKK